MTPKELAQFFNVTRRTIYRWIERGCPVDKSYDGTNTPKFKFDLEEVQRWRRQAK